MSDAVLDASAMLAILGGEPGAEVVVAAMEAGARSMSAVNLTEVVAKLVERAAPPAEIRQRLGKFDLTVYPFDEALAFEAGWIRAATRAVGLSLADRACLALSARLQLPVITADRRWSELRLPLQIVLVRPDTG